MPARTASRCSRPALDAPLITAVARAIAAPDLDGWADVFICLRIDTSRSFECSAGWDDAEVATAAADRDVWHVTHSQHGPVDSNEGERGHVDAVWDGIGSSLGGHLWGLPGPLPLVNSH